MLSNDPRVRRYFQRAQKVTTTVHLLVGDNPPFAVTLDFRVAPRPGATFEHSGTTWEITGRQGRIYLARPAALQSASD